MAGKYSKTVTGTPLSPRFSIPPMNVLMITSVANNGSTLYLTVKEQLSTYVALMMPRVI